MLAGASDMPRTAHAILRQARACTLTVATPLATLDAWVRYCLKPERQPIADRALLAALRGGWLNLDILKTWHARWVVNVTDTPISHAIALRASALGNVDVLQWLWDLDLVPVPSTLLVDAAASTATLDWWRHRYCDRNMLWTYNAAVYSAVVAGRIDLLRWWEQYGGGPLQLTHSHVLVPPISAYRSRNSSGQSSVSKTLSLRDLVRLANQGHLQILEWWERVIVSRTSSSDPLPTDMRIDAFDGSLPEPLVAPVPVLNWWLTMHHKHGLPFPQSGSEATVAAASQRGNVACLDWYWRQASQLHQADHILAFRVPRVISLQHNRAAVMAWWVQRHQRSLATAPKQHLPQFQWISSDNDTAEDLDAWWAGMAELGRVPMPPLMVRQQQLHVRANTLPVMQWWTRYVPGLSLHPGDIFARAWRSGDLDALQWVTSASIMRSDDPVVIDSYRLGPLVMHSVSVGSHLPATLLVLQWWATQQPLWVLSRAKVQAVAATALVHGLRDTVAVWIKAGMLGADDCTLGIFDNPAAFASAADVVAALEWLDASAHVSGDATGLVARLDAKADVLASAAADWFAARLPMGATSSSGAEVRRARSLRCLS
ncbi:hypothetical protein BC828DRAFT_383158 [Blastocladiella britannica]|nr:hypothetical protein BC828DRAFT_383158 [Blastocladiella britannica]